MNVTTLLVLTTLFIGTSNALPRTSYIKMIDIWLLVSLIIPFLEMILHTMLNRLHNEEDYDNEVTLFHEQNSSQEQRNQNGNKKRNNMKMNKNISEQKRKMLERLLEILGFVVLPLLYILFCITFFIIGNLAFQFK